MAYCFLSFILKPAVSADTKAAAADTATLQQTPAEPLEQHTHYPEHGNYCVQIAACRVPLNRIQLHAIYDGSENIREHFVANWYKYTIGTFTSTTDAELCRSLCGVGGAFITAGGQ